MSIPETVNQEREEEINKNNEEWEAGNAKYRTKLYDFSDWSTEEFETAKTGQYVT